VRVVVRSRGDQVVELLWGDRVRGLLTFRATSRGDAPAGWWLTLDGRPAQLLLGCRAEPDTREQWRSQTAMYAQTVAQGRVSEHVLAGLPERRRARRQTRRGAAAR